MEVDGHLKLMALDLSCQRLAQRARVLAKAGIIVDYSRLADVDRMVSRSLEALDQEISRAGPTERPEKKRISAGSLLRMLRGKDEDGEVESASARSLDTPPSREHVLNLRGLGEGFPTPDLVGFLAAQRRTGVLEVATATEVFLVEFDSGEIVHAQVNRTLPEQRLGDILVAEGSVDRETVEKLRGSSGKSRIGEQLLKAELVTQEQLMSALRTQVQLLFNRLFITPAARFSFWSGPPIHAEGGMRLNAMALILEGARTFDEGNCGLEPTVEEMDTVRMDGPDSEMDPAPAT
ncbi:MAG TPA: DUF4388 domain-containing protein [Planctomycetota bacterium]|jgi:hypothetical protein|nr:DUF4388 domain-containing protein [Planctomycetota bacterium]